MPVVVLPVGLPRASSAALFQASPVTKHPAARGTVHSLLVHSPATCNFNHYLVEDKSADGEKARRVIWVRPVQKGALNEEKQE